jgi:hypothetical protein
LQTLRERRRDLRLEHHRTATKHKGIVIGKFGQRNARTRPSSTTIFDSGWTPELRQLCTTCYREGREFEKPANHRCRALSACCEEEVMWD